MNIHPKFERMFLVLTLAAAGTAFSATSLPTDSAITVREASPARPASQNLYGIFVEDWCHQVEGGIYAEMVRNRNFDDTKSAKEVLVEGFAMRLPDKSSDPSGKALEIPAWNLIAEKPEDVQWSIDQSHPLNERNPRALKLTVNRAGPKTGISNAGHCNNVQGVAVKKGSGYRFSCFARSETPASGLTVSLRSPQGKVLSSGKIGGITGEWRKYELLLSPSESMTGALLFISPDNAGTHYLDMVSLFPKDTWKNRPNGLRKDLMEMVHAMKPAFVRFPGGCFVEGLELENAWHWKNTIGPVEQRPGHWNIWGWRYSGGMGYHEYLQMCEDLGAEPVHVVNDGISHTAKNGVYQDGVYTYQPMDKMDVLVRDALDSIEYANGPVTSEWGAKRAAAGHPEPFHLKYIEVGNENHGPEYAERYALFHDAIKAKYPEITVIMDTWGPNNYPKNRVPDMLDIHRFTTPFEFALNYNQFDNYDRKGPKVYFGEWCVDLERPHKESLEEGLYEGAFLTGLEKNSDLVMMMSYAPFMNNLGWQGRKPNMINFDLDRVYGAPVYWIQRVYSEHRVDSLLDFTATSPEYRPAKSGAVGVGTMGTGAEFKDFRVSDAGGVVFDASTARPGDWQASRKQGGKNQDAEKGTIILGDNGSQSLLTKKDFGGDYTITAKARKTSGKNGFIIYFNTRNFWQIGGDGNKSSKIVGDEFPRPQIPKLTIETNRWYDIRVEVRGDEVKCFLDGVLINEARYKPLQSLYVSAGRKDSSREIVLKVINLTPNARMTRIQLPEAKYSPTGKATVIRSEDPRARNSREKPDQVIPVETTVRNVSADFTHEFPAFSATVLRLKRESAK